MNIYNQIENEILNSKHIVITSHKSPDGDSVGSSLGLYQFIKKLGKNVIICHPDPAPDFLSWMEDIQSIINLKDHPEAVKENFAKADLIFSLDYNSPDRVGEEMQPLIENATCKKIMIDHHLDPADFVDISVSDTKASSTSELVYELVERSCNTDILDARIGAPLYLGILTDTGSFRFSSVRPRTHEVLANLLKAGVVHNLIHENLNDNNTPGRLRLQGFAMSQKLEVLENVPVAIVSLTKEELASIEHQKGDTDGIVNLALSIKGMKAAVFLSEKEGLIRMSFRSKGSDNPVNVLASQYFEGGGHANASGGCSHVSMEETLEKLKGLLPLYFGDKK